MVMAFVHLGYVTQIRSGHPAKRSNAIAMSAGWAEIRLDQRLLAASNNAQATLKSSVPRRRR